MINQVFNENCLETMRRMEDNSIDLILTDPPFGIGLSKNPIRQKHEKKEWDDEVPSDEIFNEIFRVSKNQIIWGANYFNLPASKSFLVWDKKQPYDFTLAMAELAYTSYNFPAKIYSHSNRGDEVKLHPTQKPLRLMEFCLNYARERDDSIQTVYDPFSGSGTTLVATKSIGLDYIGSEMDKDYYDVILNRLSFVQGSLF